MPKTIRRPHSPVPNKLSQMLRLVRESHQAPMGGAPRRYQQTSAAGAVTFIGHSSFLIELGGRTALVDPVFTRSLVVLRRQRHPGLDWRSLPAIDVVLLTHAHMDHLNTTSLRRAIRRTRRLRGTAPEVVVPAGVEDLVSRLGFSRVHALTWWQSTVAAGLHITMTPAQHWGARMFRDTHRGFGGYVLRAADAAPDAPSVYHSGDTAYFPGFREIGERLHPHTALLPIGAYFPDSYRAVHTSPEEALQAFVDVGASQMVPMHFGTFRLGREPMDEPPIRLVAEAERRGLRDHIHVLDEGESLALLPAPEAEPAAAQHGPASVPHAPTAS